MIDFRDSPCDVTKHILTEGDGCSADKKIYSQTETTNSFVLVVLVAVEDNIYPSHGVRLY